jgi:hypothetical protein
VKSEAFDGAISHETPRLEEKRAIRPVRPRNLARSSAAPRLLTQPQLPFADATSAIERDPEYD